MKNAKRSALWSILLVALCWRATADGQITPSDDANTNTTSASRNFGTSPLLSQTETVLHSFANSPDGANPRYVTPVLDARGNLYGTTNYGGAYGFGTVFELAPLGTEKILHSFDVNGTDGAYPESSVVLYEGSVYGTTAEGGSDNIDGTVFKLSPPPTFCRTIVCPWVERILHSFGTSGDGSQPYAVLTVDTHGNLYGTTNVGGAYSQGTVFEVTSSGAETVLWNFGNGTDGANPLAGVVLDTQGNLYGTTANGGAYGEGTVFELMPSWTETILHNFDNNDIDGTHPYAGLVMDAQGNLYGTTISGGGISGAAGTVFELTPSGGTETILHTFGGSGDGAFPWGGLVFDRSGNLYGTTFAGGANGYGTVFKVTP